MNSEIENVLERYKATAEAKDLEGHLDLYDDEILIFDLWDEWSLQGKAALREMASDWFESLESNQLKIDVEGVQSKIKTELAYSTSIIKFSAVSPGGETLRSMHNRMTLVLESRSGKWKIIHQHTSSPIDPKDLRAKLRQNSTNI